MKVGTIEGRHALPVEAYLIGQEQAAGLVPGQGAYWSAFKGAVCLIGRLTLEGADLSELDLFYTGLTEVTIGALDGFASVNCFPRLWRYDTATASYLHLKRGYPEEVGE